MSSFDHQPGLAGTIMRTVGPYALVDTDSKWLDGASTTVPAGCTTLLGIWAHSYPVTVVNDEAPQAWGYLDTEDGFNLKPFEFLYPANSCGGDTTSATSSIPGIFYPINRIWSA